MDIISCFWSALMVTTITSIIGIIIIVLYHLKKKSSDNQKIYDYDTNTIINSNDIKIICK